MQSQCTVRFTSTACHGEYSTRYIQYRYRLRSCKHIRVSSWTNQVKNTTVHYTVPNLPVVQEQTLAMLARKVILYVCPRCDKIR